MAIETANDLAPRVPGSYDVERIRGDDEILALRGFPCERELPATAWFDRRTVAGRAGRCEQAGGPGKSHEKAC